jgi:hypothetical protein
MYKCKLCNYETGDVSNHRKHLETKKHIKNINKEINTNKVKKSVKLLTCTACGMKYSRADSLKRHINNYCKKNEQTQQQLIKSNGLNEKKVRELVQEEIKNVSVTQVYNDNRVNTQISTTNTNSNNTNTVSFQNMSVDDIQKLSYNKLTDYLNESYGDLLSIEEFSKMLTLTRKEMDSIVSTHHYWDVDGKNMGIRLEELSKVYNDIIKSTYAKCIKSSLTMLPIVCGDYQVRNFKIRVLDGWASHFKVNHIRTILLKVKQLINDNYNYIIDFTEKQETSICKYIIRGSPIEKLIELEKESYLPVQKVRQEYQKQLLIEDQESKIKEEHHYPEKIEDISEPNIRRLCTISNIKNFDTTKHEFAHFESEPFRGYFETNANFYYKNINNDYCKVNERSLATYRIDSNSFIGYYIHKLHAILAPNSSYYENDDDIKGVLDINYNIKKQCKTQGGISDGQYEIAMESFERGKDYSIIYDIPHFENQSQPIFRIPKYDVNDRHNTFNDSDGNHYLYNTRTNAVYYEHNFIGMLENKTIVYKYDLRKKYILLF